MHAMIFSHITYCFTTWSQTNQTTLKPIESLYKQTLKTLDQKPNRYHHCHIVQKYNLFNFDCFKQFADACLIFKILNGLAPPPLNEFVSRRDSGVRTTRATIPDGTVKCQLDAPCLVKQSSLLEPLTTGTVREIPNYSTFKFKLKMWLKTNQICNHE